MNRTFSEQLVSEWLQLDEWLVESGVPLKAMAAGGRGEADILAVKRVEGVLRVQHIEVGSLSSGARDLELIKSKFSREKKKQICRHIEERLGEKPEYSCRYIATYVSDKSLELIRECGFRVDRLEDVIQKEILPSIMNWKLRKRDREKRRTSQLPTPPNSLWMIQLIDYIAGKKIDLSYH